MAIPFIIIYVIYLNVWLKSMWVCQCAYYFQWIKAQHNVCIGFRFSVSNSIIHRYIHTLTHWHTKIVTDAFILVLQHFAYTRICLSRKNINKAKTNIRSTVRDLSIRIAPFDRPIGKRRWHFSCGHRICSMFNVREVFLFCFRSESGSQRKIEISFSVTQTERNKTVS